MLQLKCFFKVRFAHEIELILPKYANIIKTSGRNVVLTSCFLKMKKTHINKKGC